MTLIQIRCFHTVATVGSFSKAAEQLYISQPSVSKHIAQMEQELGLPLLNRLGKNVVLTGEGRRILQYCSDILMSLEYMRKEAESLRQGVQGAGRMVRLSGVPTMGFYGLISLINSFILENPGYDVLVEELEEDKVLLNLQAGNCDIAFCSNVKIRPEYYRTLHVTSECFYAAFAKQYWSNSPDPLSLTDLWGVPLVLNRPESMLYDLCRDACVSAGFQPNVKMLSSRPEISMEYVLSHPSCYIGLSRVVELHATEEHCCRRILDSPVFHYVLCWKKDTQPTLATQKFVNYAKFYLSTHRIN